MPPSLIFLKVTKLNAASAGTKSTVSMLFCSAEMDLNASAMHDQLWFAWFKGFLPTILQGMKTMVFVPEQIQNGSQIAVL